MAVEIGLVQRFPKSANSLIEADYSSNVAK
jgi:hypothetical protein